MHIEMVTRTLKSTRYKYLVSPMGLYYILKDRLAVVSELIYSISGSLKICFGYRPIVCTAAIAKHSKKPTCRNILFKLSSFSLFFQTKLLSTKQMLFTSKKFKLAISISLPSAINKRNSVSLNAYMKQI